MKIENTIIKYGLIITVISLILLLIIQPLNQTVFENLSEEKYEIKNDLNKIDININYTKVVIRPSKSNKNEIRYLSDNSNKVVIKENNDNLVLSLKNKFKVGVNTMHLVELSLNKKTLDDLDINMEAGEIQVENMDINKLNLDLNAGNITIKNSNLNDANLIVGIGSVNYDNVKANILNSVVEMGASRLNRVDFTKEMKVKNILGKISGQQISGKHLILSGSIGKINVTNLKKGKISKLDSELGVGIKTLEID